MKDNTEAVTVDDLAPELLNMAQLLKTPHTLVIWHGETQLPLARGFLPC